jgi:hypothetical protein
MIVLTNSTIAQKVTTGTVIGTLLAYDGGSQVSATFMLDDPAFAISGSNLTVSGPLGSVGLTCVKVYSVVNGYIDEDDDFKIAITAISADGTIIMAPSGSLVSAVGTWSFGPAVANTAGEYQIMLNGTQAAGGYGLKLLIANGGTIYALRATSWYQYIPATGTAVGAHWNSLNTTTTP